MFWKSVPFPHFLFYFFPEQKSTEAFSSFPQTKEFLCEKEKTNRCCCFPPGTFMGKRRRHLPKSPIWESAVGVEGEKIPPLSLLGASSGAIEKFRLCWFFAWKIWENGDTISPPFFPRWWCLHNWDGCCSRRKNKFFSREASKSRRPTVSPKSRRKMCYEFRKTKANVFFALARIGPHYEKKNRCAHFLLRLPEFPPLSSKEIVKREGGREEVGLGMDSSLFLGSGW